MRNTNEDRGRKAHSPAEAARYIAALAGELTALSQKSGLPVLAQLLSMAALEAEKLSDVRPDCVSPDEARLPAVKSRRRQPVEDQTERIETVMGKPVSKKPIVRTSVPDRVA